MKNGYAAKKLVALRANRTQREVAKDLGISQSALQMYECGQRSPRDEIKVKIARYYGVSVETLFYAHFDHDTCAEAR